MKERKRERKGGGMEGSDTKLQYVWGRERRPLTTLKQSVKERTVVFKRDSRTAHHDSRGSWAAVLVSVCNQIITSGNTCMTRSLSQQRDFPFFPLLLSLALPQCLGNMPAGSHGLIRCFARKEPPRQSSG